MLTWAYKNWQLLPSRLHHYHLDSQEGPGTSSSCRLVITKASSYNCHQDPTKKLPALTITIKDPQKPHQNCTRLLSPWSHKTAKLYWHQALQKTTSARQKHKALVFTKALPKPPSSINTEAPRKPPCSNCHQGLSKPSSSIRTKVPQNRQTLLSPRPLKNRQALSATEAPRKPPSSSGHQDCKTLYILRVNIGFSSLSLEISLLH